MYIHEMESDSNSNTNIKLTVLVSFTCTLQSSFKQKIQYIHQAHKVTHDVTSITYSHVIMVLDRMRDIVILIVFTDAVLTNKGACTAQYNTRCIIV